MVKRLTQVETLLPAPNRLSIPEDGVRKGSDSYTASLGCTKLGLIIFGTLPNIRT